MNTDKQYLQDLLRRQMYLSKQRLQVIAIDIALGISALILVRASTVERRDAADLEQAEVVITEAQAIETAFQEAKDLGLTDPPTVWPARHISFGGYSTLAVDRTRTFAGTPDVSPPHHVDYLNAWLVEHCAAWRYRSTVR